MDSGNSLAAVYTPDNQNAPAGARPRQTIGAFTQFLDYGGFGPWNHLVRLAMAAINEPNEGGLDI